MNASANRPLLLLAGAAALAALVFALQRAAGGGTARPAGATRTSVGSDAETGSAALVPPAAPEREVAEGPSGEPGVNVEILPREVIPEPVPPAAGEEPGTPEAAEEPAAAARTGAGLLAREDGQPGDWFGCDVALDGSRLVVGARQDDDLGLNAGAAVLYELRAGAWNEVARLLPEQAVDVKGFGSSVALAGDRVLVGAQGSLAGAGPGGAAFLFEERGGDWTWAGALDLPPAEPEEVRIVVDVALSGEAALVSTATLAGGSGPGVAVHVFAREGERWVLRASLERPGLTGSVDLRERTAVATAVVDGVPVVHVLEVPETPEAPLEPETVRLDGERADSLMGAPVAIRGHRMAVGAPGRHPASFYSSSGVHRPGCNGDQPGRVHILERGAEGWHLTETLHAPEARACDLFGRALGLDEDVLLVGARGAVDGEDGGAAWLFERRAGEWESAGLWESTGRIEVPNPALEDGQHRQAVAVSRRAAVVGSYEHARGAGGVVTAVRTGGGWRLPGP